jgi:hypothetical protein
LGSVYFLFSYPIGGTMNDLLASASAVLVATPSRWASLAQTIPADLLSLPPARGEWSALECLQHLIDTEPVFQFRVEAFLAGRDFPAFDPDNQGMKPDVTCTQADLAAEYARLRKASLDAMAHLTQEDLNRQARHQELGQVTLSEMINEWAAHDLMHTMQAERAMMQPFIKGCGPWLSYFKDHVQPAT